MRISPYSISRTGGCSGTLARRSSQNQTRLCPALLLLLLGLIANKAQAQRFSQTFTYKYNRLLEEKAISGISETFTVPVGVTRLHVVVEGASGGNLAENFTSRGLIKGGKGGKVEADLIVTPRQVLNLYLGGYGGTERKPHSPFYAYDPGGCAGYQGGGLSFGTYDFAGGGGGGYTAIELQKNGDWLVVAGGGGGGGWGNGEASKGGDGGGLVGATGRGDNGGGGGGGTQTAGGTSQFHSVVNGVGSFLIGGYGSNIYSFNSGGGGGGYYGGGGGNTTGKLGTICGGGGGGSSYTSPTLATNVIHTQGGASGANGKIIISWEPKVLYVKADARGTRTGQTWADAFNDLQAALEYARANPSITEIWVAGGLYKPTTSTTDRTKSFAMLPNVAIYGGFAGDETTLAQRKLSYPSSTTLSGDINNDGTLGGNSYHVINNPPGLTNTAVLDGLVIAGGNADGTGADANGGGMSSLNSVPLISNCLFINNFAEGSGGGLLLLSEAAGSISSCGFVNNIARAGGGGIYSYGSIIWLNNTSFQGNASPSGGAVYALTGIGQSARVANSIFWNNGGTNTFGGSALLMEYSMTESTVGGYTDQGNNLTTATSPFQSSTDIYLKPSIAAIDAGNATAPPTDMAGKSRKGAVDMGALEFRGNQLYVNARATGANTGLSWADAFTNLQTALQSARTNPLVSEIWVAGGLYKPTTSTYRTTSFAMVPNVAIYGGFDGTETILEVRNLTYPSSTTLSGDINNDKTLAGNSYHVINNPDGLTETAILDGFVITGGNAIGPGADANGGGITFTNGRPTLVNCFFFKNNAAGAGGALYTSLLPPTPPTLDNCAFMDNTAQYGGAISMNQSSLWAINCSFQGNSAQYGGAIDGTAPNGVFIKSCVFWNNGGANTFSRTPMLLQDCLFDNTVTGFFDYPLGNKTTTGNPFVSSRSVALAVGAPAIDAGGFSNPAIKIDMAGNPRRVRTLDMGALEFQETPVTTPGSATLAGIINQYGYEDVFAGYCDLTVRLIVTGQQISLTGPGNFTSTREFRSPVVNYNIDIPHLTKAGTYTLSVVGAPGQAPFVKTYVFFGGRDCSKSDAAVQPALVNAGRQSARLATPAPAGLAITLSPSAVYGTGPTKRVRVTLTGGTDNEQYGIQLYGGAPGNTTDLTNYLIMTSTSQGGGNTITWTPGTTSVYFDVAFDPGAVGARLILEVTNPDFSDFVDSYPFFIQDCSVQNPGLTPLESGSTVCEGSVLTLAPEPLDFFTAYQWYKDGISLGEGQRSPNLSLGLLRVEQSGSYVLATTDACNSLTSTAFALVVNPLPTVTLSVNGTNLSGQSPTITLPQNQEIMLQASGGVDYDWRVVIDRFNGYEFRHTERNSTGLIRITRPGPYRLAVTGANGCERVFEGEIRTP